MWRLVGKPRVDVRAAAASVAGLSLGCVIAVWIVGLIFGWQPTHAETPAAATPDFWQDSRDVRLFP